MAPVTRNFLETFSFEQKKAARTGVSLEGKHYKPFRLVHCTVHLDQMDKNKASLRKMEKLGQKSFKKTTGRIIHPMVFKLFKSQMLSKPTKDGNATFIINYNRLLTRFPRVFDNGVSKTANGFSQSLLLTRGKRDVSRYTPLVGATPSTKGDIWWRDDDQNMILTPNDPKSEEHLDLEVNVDVLPSDFQWLRRNWACEFLDHEQCTKFGELCTNLMDRGVAWEACNF